MKALGPICCRFESGGIVRFLRFMQLSKTDSSIVLSWLGRVMVSKLWQLQKALDFITWRFELGWIIATGGETRKFAELDSDSIKAINPALCPLFFTIIAAVNWSSVISIISSVTTLTIPETFHFLTSSLAFPSTFLISPIKPLYQGVISSISSSCILWRIFLIISSGLKQGTEELHPTPIPSEPLTRTIGITGT